MSISLANMTTKSATKKPAEHPPYSEMAVTAIGALKERSGSSRQAILKYIQAHFKVGDNCNTHLKLALKRGVMSGKLTQAKGTGASGSFKLVAKAKAAAPKKKPAAKKPTTPKKTAAKKPAAKKTAAAKKTPTKKKPAKKTATPKKAASKKPAAKKVKKPAAKKPAAKKTAKK